MDNEFNSIKEINEELSDLRSEVVAQGLIINILLSFIEKTYGIEMRKAMTDGIGDAFPILDENDEGSTARIEMLRKKLRQYCL